MSDDARHAPIEFRSADISAVNFPERLVTVVAVPYEQEALIEYRGEMWQESFLRGAFDGRANRVRVNREHDESKTFGKVVTFHPSRQEGLVAEIRVAKTSDGDDILELANEDMLGASAAFGVRPSDQELDRPFRRIKKAFIRHLSFVEVPAYEGAGVLSVRGQGSVARAADLPPLVTPNLDEVLAWLKSRGR
jgi:HK97 family phage prohead protease